MLKSLRLVKRRGIPLCLLLLMPIVVQATPQTKNRRSRKPPAIVAIDRYVREIDAHIKRHQRAARVFANLTSEEAERESRWYEFKDEHELDMFGEGKTRETDAHVWFRAGKAVGVHLTFQSASGDWAHFITYYFRPDGSLAKIDATLNTFYGHITAVREKFYSREGVSLRVSEKFYELGTTKKREPNIGGEEFMDQPIPVYKKISDLPFYHLLKKQRSARAGAK